MEIINSNPIELRSDTGKVLTNGEIYSKTVYLGKADNLKNWREILEEDIPQEEFMEDENTQAIQILSILLGEQ